MRAIVLAGITLAALGAGCTPEATRPKPLVNYTPTVLDNGVDQLKASVESKLRETSYFELASYRNLGRVGCYSWSFTLRFETDRVLVQCTDPWRYDDKGTHRIGTAHVYTVYYDELSEVAFSPDTCTTKTVLLPGGMKAFIPGISPAVCDTFYSLGQHYRQQQEEGAAAFTAQAARYRAAATRPQMTEDLRRIIVQAEAARQRKDYAQAAELFQAALRKDAVAYPAGWFNLALLYEQQERYRRATEAMRRYLALEPGAKDARAAQDKIYEWEGLAERK